MTADGTRPEPASNAAALSWSATLDAWDHRKLVTACAHEIGHGTHSLGSGSDHRACESHLDPVGADDLTALLDRIEGWQLLDERLVRRFDFPDFDTTMGFVGRVAALSRRLNHHPDIHVENKRSVYLVLWTHKAQAVTTLDTAYVQELEAGLRAAPAANGR